jgi:hypothetical protein
MTLGKDFILWIYSTEKSPMEYITSKPSFYYFRETSLQSPRRVYFDSEDHGLVWCRTIR